MTFDEMENPKTFLPGVKAKHVVISTACRELHGNTGACSAAQMQIRAELWRLMDAWPQDKRATFHLVLTVDREGRSA